MLPFARTDIRLQSIGVAPERDIGDGNETPSTPEYFSSGPPSPSGADDEEGARRTHSWTRFNRSQILGLVSKLVALVTLILTALMAWPAISSADDARLATLLAEWTSKKEYRDFCEAHDWEPEGCAPFRTTPLPPPPSKASIFRRIVKFRLPVTGLVSHLREKPCVTPEACPMEVDGCGHVCRALEHTLGLMLLGTAVFWLVITIRGISQDVVSLVYEARLRDSLRWERRPLSRSSGSRLSTAQMYYELDPQMYYEPDLRDIPNMPLAVEIRRRSSLDRDRAPDYDRIRERLQGRFFPDTPGEEQRDGNSEQIGPSVSAHDNRRVAAPYTVPRHRRDSDEGASSSGPLPRPLEKRLFFERDSYHNSRWQQEWNSAEPTLRYRRREKVDAASATLLEVLTEAAKDL